MYQNMPRMLRTRKETAEYCGVHPDTISRWFAKHAFPACFLPNGKLATRTTLIDLWIRVRGKLQRAKIAAHKAGKPTQGYVEAVDEMIDEAIPVLPMS
jgi:hypothetical protein